MAIPSYGRSLALGACLTLVSAALALSGCARQEPTPDARVQVQDTTNGGSGQKEIRDPGQVSAHLEALARGVRGVRDANCVIFGPYAIVGIDVEETLERSEVGTIKYAVAEAFRKDPYGIDAVVTADLDLAQRIREIRADIRRGRPIAGFAEELADLVGRLVPQLPRDIVPPDRPDVQQQRQPDGDMSRKTRKAQ